MPAKASAPKTRAKAEPERVESIWDKLERIPDRFEEPPPKCSTCKDTNFVVAGEQELPGFPRQKPCPDCRPRALRAKRLRKVQQEMPFRYQRMDFEHPVVARLPDDVLGKLRDFEARFEDFYAEHGIGLYLTGPTGAGKTSAAAAIANIIGRRMETGRCMFYRWDNLVALIKDSFDPENQEMSESQLHQAFAKVDLMVIDDIGAAYLTDWVKSQLNRLISNRYDAQRPTIITTDLTDADIAQTFERRLRDRLFGRIEGWTVRIHIEPNSPGRPPFDLEEYQRFLAQNFTGYGTAPTG